MGFQPSQATEERYILGVDTDDSIDWTAKGAVTPVKN